MKNMSVVSPFSAVKKERSDSITSNSSCVSTPRRNSKLSLHLEQTESKTKLPSQPGGLSPKGRFINYNRISVDDDEDERAFQFESFNFWKYLQVEMFGVGDRPPDSGSRNASESIKNFLNVPLKLFRLIFFGYFICLDSFLYIFTFLPIRILFSLFLLLVECLSVIINTLSKRKRADKKRFLMIHIIVCSD